MKQVDELTVLTATRGSLCRPPHHHTGLHQVVPHQVHLGEEAEAEPPRPSVDPVAHGKHYPVSDRVSRGSSLTAHGGVVF